ncbi:hypothetical protein [Croceicoccus sp. BE223]|uniref:hypothetical protein n=1 Tax=Croceicoccus sp. BE223 TaxID=2817716 RepID=UPI002856D133|nr:hypothetical protein [Croceicoccus sp. BE223]MDR7102817.1 hypothetical protein [Croceicoccus sp. BE223]
MAEKPKGERAPDEWRSAFLETLSRTSNISAAARAAKVDAGLVYRTRRSDPVFAKAWYQALCDGYDLLELDLLRRLRMGDTENPNAKRKRKYDNATAFRLLSAHREAVSKARAEQEQMAEEDIIASINAKIDMMRQRMKAAAANDAGTGHAAGNDSGSNA